MLRCWVHVSHAKKSSFLWYINLEHNDILACPVSLPNAEVYCWVNLPNANRIISTKMWIFVIKIFMFYLSSLPYFISLCKVCKVEMICWRSIPWIWWLTRWRQQSEILPALHSQQPPLHRQTLKQRMSTYRPQYNSNKHPLHRHTLKQRMSTYWPQIKQ